MRVSATAKYLRGSTRKARLITTAIKGKPRRYLAVAETRTVGSSYFSDVDRSVCLPCPR